MNRIYDNVTKSMPTKDFSEPLLESALIRAYASLGFGVEELNPPTGLPSSRVDAWQFGTCLNSLEAAQLIRTRYDLVNMSNPGPYYSLTYLGYQFVLACRPPKPKE